MESEHYPLMMTVAQIRQMSDEELDHWLDTMAMELTALVEMFDSADELVDMFFAEWLRKQGKLNRKESKNV